MTCTNTSLTLVGRMVERRRATRSFLSLLILLTGSMAYGQLWSGLLKPTSGAGACSFGQVTAAGQCAVDWTQVGLPGGIPSDWTQSGSTIPASACGNGSSDCTSTIQAALNACAGTGLPGKFVLLGSGTFLIRGNLHIKNYCYLSGADPQSTIIRSEATSGAPVIMGSVNDAPYKNGTCTITAGNIAGSNSIKVSATGLDGNPCSVAVGGYLVISELSDPVYVSGPAPQNPGGCGYCDVMWGGTRLREQIVEMTSVSGSGPYTVGISPALYTNYGVASGTSPAYATPFGALNGGKPDCKYCGLENLQIYATGTGLSAGMADINMTECAYCFVYRMELNYTDGDWLDAAYCYRCEIRDNYFTSAFGHGAGGTDADLQLNQESSASLIINNILERGHSALNIDMGAAGNVIAYNYSAGSYDAVGVNANQLDFVEHGAYPQFNLWEGNVGPNWQPDSWHGNNGYNTVFRNWWTGANTVAPYTRQQIKSISCSGGTCTINWTNPPSQFYAGTYINIYGTNQVCLGNGSNIGLNSVNFRLTGNAGSLSSTFSAGCSSGTGGFAATLDIVNNPAPITHLAMDWNHTYNTYQTPWAITVPAFSVGNNIIGNALGSDQQVATVGAGNMYDSGVGSCPSCLQAPSSRPYSGDGATSTYGYDTSGDSNGSAWLSFPGGPSNVSGYWSTQGFTTTFYHGNYDAASASTIWDVNASGSHTLPVSLFLTSQPSWFGSAPWPPIGPDVTGGPDKATGGHANYIPAQLCYMNTSRDNTGVKQFNPSGCYGNNNTQIDPPTGLTATVQ